MLVYGTSPLGDKRRKEGKLKRSPSPSSRESRKEEEEDWREMVWRKGSIKGIGERGRGRNAFVGVWSSRGGRKEVRF